MKTQIYRFVFIGLFIITLQACGNKGDLYLPDKNTDQTEQTS